MSRSSRKQRFVGIAAYELNGGERREPVWRQALEKAGASPAKAARIYEKLRVEQMVEDEKRREKDQEETTIRQRFNDSLGLTPGRRNALLGLGIILALLLGLALAWRQ